MKRKIVSSVLSVVLAFSIFGGLSLIGVVEARTVSPSRFRGNKNARYIMEPIDSTECPIIEEPIDLTECLPEEPIEECPLAPITDEECLPEEYVVPARIKNAFINATNVTIKVGEEFNVMKNVSARDDGGKGVDLTNKITVEGVVNTRKLGSYNITYSVKGANENLVLKTIIVYVKK